MVVHHFSDGLYAKETFIPAGTALAQHKHTYDHLSILAQGHVWVYVGGKRREYSAPACITIKANQHHAVQALTNTVWYCIHATEVADPNLVDASLVAIDPGDAEAFLKSVIRED